MADGGDVGCVSRGGTPFATNVVGDPPGIDRRTTYCRLVSQYCQERMVCDRSSPDDGPRPTVGKTDAFQEDGEGAGLGEGITGQTHLSNLSRARAGAAAHDGAIGQSTRWMLAICLEPSAAHELASWRASRYATSLGSGPGVRTGKRRRGGSPGPEEKVRHGATRPMHKSSPGNIAGAPAMVDPGAGPGGQPLLHGQGEPGSSLPLLPAALPEDAADSSGAGSECSGLQSEVLDNSSDGELGSEDLHDSVGNGPETFQWDIDAQGWDFSGHQHHAPQSSPQRKLSHVGRRPWARRLLALVTRK